MTMVLNDLNILTKTGNIQVDPYGRPYAFFPAKWRIVWTFNSGTPINGSVYTESAAINCSFRWKNPAGTHIDVVKDGKIFKKTIDAKFKTDNCSCVLSMPDNNSVRCDISQSTAGRTTYSASGEITLIADHYNGTEMAAPGIDILANLRTSITQFNGIISTSVPTTKYPDMIFTYNITMEDK